MSGREEQLAAGGRLKAFLAGCYNNRYGWQTKLVAESGVRRSTIQGWFAGKSEPDLKSLRQIASKIDRRPFQLVAALDGDGRVVALGNPGTKDEMRDLLEELLAERDERRPPKKPSGGPSPG